MTISVSARVAHWGIRLIAVGVVLGFVGFSQPAVQACEIYCVDGDNGCAADEHYAYETWMGTRDGNEHFACVQGDCNELHLQCGAPVPAEDLDVLEHAAIAGDRAKVESILDEHPSLTVNIDRSALQQLDCGGNVVVHIPVPSTSISDVSAVSQR
jgi:hypothetical protein